MSAMDIDLDPSTVLITLREESDPELYQVYSSLEDLYDRKLWYQLTVALSNEFYGSPLSKGFRLRLFENFILKFNEKINQLKLIEFLILSLDDVKTLNDKLEYLLQLKERISNYGLKKSKEDDLNDLEILQALVFIDCEISKMKLKLELTDESSALIDDCSKRIDQLNSVDNRINASYYSACAELNKVKGDYNSFYHNSLLFLACLNDDISRLEHKEEIINDIIISGLLGDSIYNFGEIIMHDLFKYSKVEYLKELMTLLNNGDLNKFNKILQDTNNLNKYSDISKNVEFLRQKICIMSLIELIFSKPTTNKNLTFKEILDSNFLLKDFNEVEYLLMKCLSLKLIKGSIDQVNSQVEISWIKSRTMTQDQIKSMKDKLSIWNEKVVGMTEYMNNSGKELWV
ncbi:hypothetical protein BVG19_g4344 [[Candida] boidinii]|nr:hypothetical protein BVG19_g4344 [[Candida] boidinii]OWB50377.1 hypothetical protein B5S27_g1927 [[Candida] boidinii]OWB68369.1 hypothetical protein B5S30_g3747 [[Candida] boidinii]